MRTFLVVLVLVGAFCSINVYSQDAAVSAQKTEAKALTVADFDGLTEEQILALLKGMTLDDILRCLQMVMTSGRTATMGNFLGALNSFLATSGMSSEETSSFVDRVLQENPSLGVGYGKGGNPVIFIKTVNQTINSMIRYNLSGDGSGSNFKPISRGGSKD